MTMIREHTRHQYISKCDEIITRLRKFCSQITMIQINKYGSISLHITGEHQLICLQISIFTDIVLKSVVISVLFSFYRPEFRA